jgi:hypothetical protein
MGVVSPVVYTLTMFLKGDEVLAVKNGQIKGRTISSIDTTIQVELAVFLDNWFIAYKRAMDKIHCHKFTDGSNDVLWFRFTVGSGLNSDALNIWRKKTCEEAASHTQYVGAIFAGDDFLAIVNDHGQLLVVESDKTKYDRTQGVHALFQEHELLELFGLPAAKRKVLAEQSKIKAKYQNRKLDISMKCPMPTQRDTGGADTTLGNTINLQMTFYDVLVNSGTNVYKYEKEWRKFGFIPKIKIFHTLPEATFLKGWWADGFHWMPLPSQVVKAGKVMTDPKKIFPHLEPLKAWEATAKCVALGFGHVPDNYPILGALLKRYKRSSDEDVEEQIPKFWEAHKVRVDAFADISRDSCMDQMMKRYAIDKEDILSFEQKISQSIMPSIIYHKIYDIMVSVDYR